jgi:hypothetical protein
MIETIPHQGIYGGSTDLEVNYELWQVRREKMKKKKKEPINLS